MAPQKHRVYIADGPRSGEHVEIDVRPDGGLPREVSLGDPLVDGATEAEPSFTSDSAKVTTYSLVQITSGDQAPIYRAKVEI